jgi:hypothetical protein
MNWDGIISLLLATLETLLIINLLIFVDKNKQNNLVLILVTLFASYQMMEFLICNQELKLPIFTYIAFLIITLIPIINYFFILIITNNLTIKIFSLLGILFVISGLFFIVFYGINYHLFKVEKCSLFYATYNYPLEFLYGLYYYSPILISFLLLLKLIRNTNKLEGRKKLLPLLIGYFFIIIPPVLGFTLLLFNFELLLKSMESILCKFAFFYALCLSYYSLSNSKFKDERNYLKYLSGYK